VLSHVSCHEIDDVLLDFIAGFRAFSQDYICSRDFSVQFFVNNSSHGNVACQIILVSKHSGNIDDKYRT
jgi:hypothetical protein